MKTRAQITVAVIIVVLVLGLTLWGTSAGIARVACDKLVGERQSEMPYVRTRFTLSPGDNLFSKHPLPRRACWIVSYVDSSGIRSLGFQTDLVGNVLASGIPICVPAVAKYLGNLRLADQEIGKAVTRAESLINTGMTHSNVLVKLGPPMFEMTNGEVVWMSYNFGQPSMPDCFVTNGIEVAFTNGIVTDISHAYASIVE